MTLQIKQRIEQIQRGEVPEGYKKTKVGVVPCEWEDTLFSDLFTSTSEYTEDLEKYPLYSLTIEEGITAKTERYERSHLVKKENAYKIVRPNDFAYNPMNVRFGAVARHKGAIDVAVSGYYDIFTTRVDSDLEFMDSFLISDHMIAYYNKVSIGSLVEKQRITQMCLVKLRLLIYLRH
jgi:type I restriction enzyme S subunit